jgi:hypothetical protein
MDVKAGSHRPEEGKDYWYADEAHIAECCREQRAMP